MAETSYWNSYFCAKKEDKEVFSLSLFKSSPALSFAPEYFMGCEEGLIYVRKSNKGLVDFAYGSVLSELLTEEFRARMTVCLSESRLR